MCTSDGLDGLSWGSMSDGGTGWGRGNSSSDSGGLKRGESGKSEVRSSVIERCFRMGFLAMPLGRMEDGDEGRSKAAAVVGEGFGV